MLKVDVSLSLLVGLIITVITGMLWVGWSGETFVSDDVFSSVDYYGWPFSYLKFHAWGFVSKRSFFVRSHLFEILPFLVDWLLFSIFSLMTIRVLEKIIEGENQK